MPKITINMILITLYKRGYVGKSIVMKRFRPRAKGRAAPIKKPFSRITIILEEKQSKTKKTRKINNGSESTSNRV